MTALFGAFAPSFPKLGDSLKPIGNLAHVEIKIATNFQGALVGGYGVTGNGMYPAWITWRRLHPDGQPVLSIDPWVNSAMSDAEVSAWLQRGANGEFDTQMIAFAKKLNSIPELRDAWVRFMREMSGKWYNWRAGANPKAFKAFFTRFCKIMRQYAPRAKVVFNYASTQGILRNMRGQNGKVIDIIPDDHTLFDYLALDHYDVRGAMSPMDGWEKRTLPELQLLEQIASDIDVPPIVCEWGLWDKTQNKDGGDNPIFIQKWHDYVMDPDCSIYSMSYQNGGPSQITGAKFPRAKDKMSKLRWAA